MSKRQRVSTSPSTVGGRVRRSLVGCPKPPRSSIVTCDVLVVGGGPAGATAATVTWPAPDATWCVVDKADVPARQVLRRRPHHAGAAPARGARPRSGGRAQLASGARRRAALAVGPGGASSTCRATGSSPPPRRGGELDAALVDLARAAGAAVLDGHAADATSAPDGDHGAASTSTASAPCAARYVIAADGMWSPVRKLLGHAEEGYLGEWHAFRQYAAASPARRPTGSVRVVRARSAARLRLELPAARRTGQPRLRRAARRQPQRRRPARAVVRAVDRPHIAAALGPVGRARGAAHGVADPGRHRPGDARRRAGAVRRRRGDGHRHDDRRGHRPGRAHRTAGGRGDRRRRRPPAGRRGRRATTARRGATSSPTTACRRSSSRRSAIHAAPVGRCAWSTPAVRGASATSPAGCSRTSPGRSPSRRALAPASSPAPAPTAPRRRRSRRGPGRRSASAR